MVPGLLIERAGAVRSAPGKSCRKFGRPAKLTAEQAAFARRLKANGETAYAGPLASSATVGTTGTPNYWLARSRRFAPRCQNCGLIVALSG